MVGGLKDSVISRGDRIANWILIVFTVLMFFMFVGYAWWLKQLAGSVAVPPA